MLRVLITIRRAMQVNERNILQDAGKVSHQLMVELAEKKFDEYKQIEAKQDVDFDEVILKALESVKKKDIKVVKDKKL